jgi:hypothetical protein
MDFYKQIFKLMFYFDLCFTHEPRPFNTLDSRGNIEYKEYDRHELLMQDASGDWFYNTDFAFKAEMSPNLPDDKTFLYEQTIQLAQYGAIKPEQLWQVLDSLDFPVAKMILEQTQEDKQEGMMMLSIIGGLPPDQMQQFLQLTTEEQYNFLNQAMKGGEQNG